LPRRAQAIGKDVKTHRRLAGSASRVSTGDGSMPLPLTDGRVAPLRALSSPCGARGASLRPPGDTASAPPTIPAKGARAEGALPR
jgi:hypothetical protein